MKKVYQEHEKKENKPEKGQEVAPDKKEEKKKEVKKNRTKNLLIKQENFHKERTKSVNLPLVKKLVSLQGVSVLP